MKGRTIGTPVPQSRYFKLSEEARQEVKRRSRARYQADPEGHRRRIYCRLLEAGRIKCPSESTLLRYGIPLESYAVRRKSSHLESDASTNSSMENSN